MNTKTITRHGIEAQLNPRRKRSRRAPASTSLLVPAVQAAEEIGVPYTTLRELTFRGEIPVLRLGTAWYFERGDIARFIERAKQRLGEHR
jgi:excisionase family DNA binding protein